MGYLFKGKRRFRNQEKLCSMELINWLVSQVSDFVLRRYSFCFLLCCMNSITHYPFSCLCCLMDVRLVNALAVSFCCVPAVICACDYKLVVTCWIFWHVVRCNQLFFTNVPYAFTHYPCEADIASSVLH